MPSFERVRMSPAERDKVWSTFPDRNVFQSSAWLAFLAEDQDAEPVVAALRDETHTLGYFTGAIVKKLGVRILGSPFRGWSTPYMGFNLQPGVARRLAFEALRRFAFDDLRCLYCEVVDLPARAEDVGDLGCTQEMCPTIEIDLTQSEDALLANMTKSCRWTVRKAEKNGVKIEEANDPEFADDYAAHLSDVFAKQGMVPHYGAERVRAMIKHVHPTGALLLLRARDPEGRCIASAILPAAHQTAFYLGGASLRQYQNLYPNELIQWHAMRYWKQRGITTYNMVGNMDFKRKFGGQETAVPMINCSKHRWMAQARIIAPKIMRTAMQAAWKVKSLGRKNPPTAGD